MIVCVGELLADLIGSAPGRDGAVRFSRYAGGAPFNVACGVKAAGGKSGFIGRVGADITGRFLASFAASRGLDLIKIEEDKEHNTTLAFVELDEKGERRFCFARKFAADYRIEDDFSESFASADIVHVGSLMLSEEEGRAVCARAFSAAKRQGKKVSFDVNFREDLFGFTQKTREMFLAYIAEADIVKVSEEELAFLTNTKAGAGDWFIAPLSALAGEGGKIVALTLGGAGCAVAANGALFRVAARSARAVDTTGAGDAFYAAFLARLDKKAPSAADLVAAARFANAAAGHTVEGYGAIVPLPPPEVLAAEGETLAVKKLG